MWTLASLVLAPLLALTAPYVTHVSSPLFAGGIVGTVFVIIIAIIVAGLLIWALKLAINTFIGPPWAAKAIVLLYIVIALVLSAILLRWAGLV
jgi:hypothetical protein